MSRPSLYSDDIIKAICDRLGDGEPLAQICRNEGMPAYRTIWEWMQERENVSKAIARAREEGEDVIASNLRLIARGTSVESTKDVQRDKLIIDTDLKLLAKWNPKKYGEKQSVDIDHSSKDKSMSPSATRLSDMTDKIRNKPAE